MTGYKRVNYYELCRLCTSSQPKEKIHIFRDEGRKMQLQQKIQTCFPLLVCEHDYLPKVICTNCIETLDQCYTFRQNCINSETMLSSYFSNFRFTDDFKKAGKVYVKDTGQKLENMNPNPNTAKKIVQENDVPNMLENNQQFFTLELPALSNKVVQNYTKLQIPNNITINNSRPSNNEYINHNLNINSQQKIDDSLKAEIKTNNNQLNVTSCNINMLNFSSNINSSKPHFETRINNETSSEFNVIKNNIVQSMMFIDVEQLIESGLAETEINKLKEVFLKQQSSSNPKLINTDSNIFNNLNNNQNNNEFGKGSKNFKCDICNKVFKRREHLYQHSKLHSGLRPFNCIHCPKTFSRKEHLMRHLTSHSGVKDYSCDVCDKKFSRPDNLKKHKKTHQKTGPFVCDICQKSFVIKHYYLVHKLQHHEGGAILNSILKADGSDL